MSTKLIPLFLLLSTYSLAQNKSQTTVKNYFPPPQYWQHKTPTEMGLDNAKIQEAIAFHKANEADCERFGGDSGLSSYCITYKSLCVCAPSLVVQRWCVSQRVREVH